MAWYSKLFGGKKIHYKRIPLTPTPFKLELYHCSKDDFNSILKTKYDLEENECKEKIEGAGAITIFINDGKRKHIIVAIFNKSIYNTSHEAVHASWFLDELCGLNFNQNNQETQAYYVGYITQEIGVFLKTINN